MQPGAALLGHQFLRLVTLSANGGICRGLCHEASSTARCSAWAVAGEFHSTNVGNQPHWLLVIASIDQGQDYSLPARQG